MEPGGDRIRLADGTYGRCVGGQEARRAEEDVVSFVLPLEVAVILNGW